MKITSLESGLAKAHGPTDLLNCIDFSTVKEDDFNYILSCIILTVFKSAVETKNREIQNYHEKIKTYLDDFDLKLKSFNCPPLYIFKYPILTDLFYGEREIELTQIKPQLINLRNDKVDFHEIWKNTMYFDQGRNGELNFEFLLSFAFLKIKKFAPIQNYLEFSDTFLEHFYEDMFKKNPELHTYLGNKNFSDLNNFHRSLDKKFKSFTNIAKRSHKKFEYISDSNAIKMNEIHSYITRHKYSIL